MNFLLFTKCNNILCFSPHTCHQKYFFYNIPILSPRITWSLHSWRIHFFFVGDCSVTILLFTPPDDVTVCCTCKLHCILSVSQYCVINFIISYILVICQNLPLLRCLWLWCVFFLVFVQGHLSGPLGHQAFFHTQFLYCNVASPVIYL